jgi:hypothetical protein
MLDTSLDMFGGIWWRFDAYEIRDGYIQPKPGAVLEAYAPWNDFAQARSGRVERQAPYEALLSLLTGLAGTPPAAANERITSWCAQHGLLGILVHRVEAAVYAPVVLDAETAGAWLGQANAAGDVVVVPHFQRSGHGWRWGLTSELGTAGKTAVYLQPLRPDEMPVVVSLGDTWGTFFPAVPPDQRGSVDYPPPLTSDFWEVYAEPVDTFLDGARALLDAFEHLEYGARSDIADEATQVAVRYGLAAIDVLVSPVRASLHRLPGGSYTQVWLAPSLLASYAMMAMNDLSTARRVLRGLACGSLFTAAAYQRRYCTSTCRRREEKRTTRRNRRSVLPDVRS